jgi:hypothetical protein
MNDFSRRPRSTAAERAVWAQRFFQSGLLLREFAAQHGLKLSTLQRWVASSPGAAPGTPGCQKNKIISSSLAPVFAQVEWPLAAGSSGSASSSAWAAELFRADGSILRLAHDVSPALLKQLLRAC